jgi:hypothetical protein
MRTVIAISHLSRFCRVCWGIAFFPTARFHDSLLLNRKIVKTEIRICRFAPEASSLSSLSLTFGEQRQATSEHPKRA